MKSKKQKKEGKTNKENVTVKDCTPLTQIKCEVITTKEESSVDSSILKSSVCLAPSIQSVQDQERALIKKEKVFLQVEEDKEESAEPGMLTGKEVKLLVQQCVREALRINMLKIAQQL